VRSPGASGNETTTSRLPKDVELSTGLRARVGECRAAPVTTAVLVIFAGVFVATLWLPQEAVLDWLAPRSFDVWSGGFGRLYVLVLANFVHLAAWHIVLNLMATYHLGRHLEPLVGPLRFAGLLLGSGLVASGTQLALFGNLGIGGSGMGYGLFGFGLAARRKYPELREVLTVQTSAVWIGWFLACWLAPALGVANGGHLGGLLFGLVSGIGAARPAHRFRRLAQAAMIIVAVAAGRFPLWQAGYWAATGYRAHKAHAYRRAIDAYLISLEIDPTQVWVRANLVRAEAWSGRSNEARASLDELLRQEPARAATLLEELKHDGKAPWAQ
jgi:membrane associated rhomboid family serine protease